MTKATEPAATYIVPETGQKVHVFVEPTATVTAPLTAVSGADRSSGPAKARGSGAPNPPNVSDPATSTRMTGPPTARGGTTHPLYEIGSDGVPIVDLSPNDFNLSNDQLDPGPLAPTWDSIIAPVAPVRTGPTLAYERILTNRNNEVAALRTQADESEEAGHYASAQRLRERADAIEAEPTMMAPMSAKEISDIRRRAAVMANMLSTPDGRRMLNKKRREDRAAADVNAILNNPAQRQLIRNYIAANPFANAGVMWGMMAADKGIENVPSIAALERYIDEHETEYLPARNSSARAYVERDEFAGDRARDEARQQTLSTAMANKTAAGLASEMAQAADATLALRARTETVERLASV